MILPASSSSSSMATKQSVHHLSPAASANCTHCEAGTEEDTEHAFLHCRYNSGAGQVLLNIVQRQTNNTTASSLLRLELPNLTEDDELSITTFISAFLLAIWERRNTKLRLLLYDIMAAKL